MRKKMSNKDIQGFLNSVYNGWFCKWRDNLPEFTDIDAWAVIVNEGVALIERYQEYEDGDFTPCTIIIQQLANILDDRKRSP